MARTQDNATVAKVRAMYGKRITGEEYSRMANMQTMDELTAFLSGQPSYARAIKSIPSQMVDRVALEDAVQRELINEYFRILNFISQDDMVIMRYLVGSMELRELMRFMRLAESGRSHEYSFSMPKYFDRYSKINYAHLANAASYGDMLEAVRDTQYHSLLSRLELRASGWPDYTMVEMAVRSSYYRWVMSVIGRKYSGAERTALREAVGLEVDMTNITAIIRLRRHFPKALEDVAGYLLPVSYKLTSATIKQLLVAPDEEVMLDILRRSGFSNFFSGVVYDEVERYYYTGMINFYRRQLRAGVPYVGTPMAYLFLKELEIRNLITLIECVRYKVPPEKALTYLYLL